MPVSLRARHIQICLVLLCCLVPCGSSDYYQLCDTSIPCKANGTFCLNRRCTCGAVSYWNGNTRTCEPKVPLGSFCWTTEACLTNNSVCSKNRCECYGAKYVQVGSSCKIDLGNRCSTASECADTPARCTTTIYKYPVCTCDTTTHYDNNSMAYSGGDCEENVKLGGPCRIQEACTTHHSLCSAGTCQCAGATYQQVKATCKVDLGYPCFTASDCADNHTVCPEDTRVCTCNTSTHYDTNTAKYSGGDCKPRVQLGSQCRVNDACITQHSLCSRGTCECAGAAYQQVDDTCRKDLGYPCSSASECADNHTVCPEDYRVCTCNTGTHYDTNTAKYSGGDCKLKSTIVG